MNILSVNKYFWKKGGSESVFFNEMEMLESAGHSVIPFSMKGSKNQPSEFTKYFVNEIDYAKPGFKNKVSSAVKIIYSYDARNKMEHLLSEHPIDIAHFHIFQHQISPSVFGPLKKRNIPIILTLHDLKPICPNYKMFVNGHICEECKGQKFYNCYKNKCTKGSKLGSFVNSVEMYFHYAMKYYQNVDSYIAASRFHLNKMVEFGFDENKITYLPNYIDVSQYQPSDQDDSYILYFGRLSSEKGVSVLLDSAKLLPHICFKVVGSGPQENELLEKCKLERINNVSFLGYKFGIDLKNILSESTCVVLPSKVYENCPMTILESFASGRPVIGSNIGGIPELIEEGEDGLTFTSGNASELAEKIKCIWDNRSTATVMGMTGRKKIEKKFNTNLHYEGLLSIYNSVLNA